MANFAPQGDSVDEADRMFDFYIAASAYPSSAQSPSGSTVVKDESGTPTSLLSGQQGFPAPSHEYGAYKQQTGIVPGALDTTLAMNQSNQGLLSYLDFNSGLPFDESDDPFNFNTSPSQDVPSQGLMSIPESMPLLMGTPAPDAFHPTVDPSYITSQEPGALNITPPMSTHSSTSSVGRLRPGMHQQAAMARAQEKVLQQQRAQARKQAHVQHKAQVQHQAHTQQQQTPIIQPSNSTDQKINAVLGSLHCEEEKIEELKSHPVLHPPTRPKKNFDEMDDDEKLLNSDAGKAMSGPAKRQIRNKVSARNFRNRRKAYIENLETEVVAMTNENALLRAKTSALSEENRRLTDLTRMLLSSPAFSQMLTDLSSQPQQFFAQQSQQQQQQQQPQMQQQQAAACGYVANAAQMGGAHAHPFVGAQYIGGMGAPRPAEAS